MCYFWIIMLFFLTLYISKWQALMINNTITLKEIKKKSQVSHNYKVEN